MSLNEGNLISLDSGQTFRWCKNSSGIYEGIYASKFYSLSPSFLQSIDNSSPLYVLFNEDFDWEYIKKYLSKKCDYLDKAIRMYPGLRVLKLEILETLISFIISACNNIPRIKKIIENLCRYCGEKIDNEHYAFPSLDRLLSLSLGDFKDLGLGFRDKYVFKALRMIESGDVDLSGIKNFNLENARAELMKIDGIGEKVADCILLFSYNKFDAFPKDVWIKRVMREKVGVDESVFGEYKGIAQQFLFMMIRNEKENSNF